MWMIGKPQKINQMNSGLEKQFSVMDKRDQTSSKSLQWLVKQDQDLIETKERQRKKPRLPSSGVWNMQ